MGDLGHLQDCPRNIGSRAQAILVADLDFTEYISAIFYEDIS